MDSKIYKFDYRAGLLDAKIYGVRDYFQYYTTGVEQVVEYNPSQFSYTNREDAERPEQIMYDLFGDENLGDMFVAINNQNYIWAVPLGLDAFQDAIDLRMAYLRYLMRDRMKQTVDNFEIDSKTEYVTTVEDVMKIRVTEDIHAEDDISRQIFIPKKDSVKFVQNRITDYFKDRELKEESDYYIRDL